MQSLKLIVGLGNPGEKYVHNRHNVGFMFVDFLLHQNGSTAQFKKDKYLLSEICEVNAEMVLAKPLTYMNKSGEAIKKLLERFGSDHQPLTTDHLIVVHDDLDIPLGKFKIQMQGPKQHNGLTDIQDKLRAMDFLRVRIGVDNRPTENRMNGEEYVLQNFIEQEEALLPELFKKIEERFVPFLQSKNITS